MSYCVSAPTTLTVGMLMRPWLDWRLLSAGRGASLAYHGRELCWPPLTLRLPVVVAVASSSSEDCFLAPPSSRTTRYVSSPKAASSSRPISRKTEVRPFLMLVERLAKGGRRRPAPSRRRSEVMCELNLGRTGTGTGRLLEEGDGLGPEGGGAMVMVDMLLMGIEEFGGINVVVKV